MKAVVHVNGPGVNDQYFNMRAYVTELMQYIFILNKFGVDADKFKSMVEEYSGVETSEGYDLLEKFTKLTKSEKIDVISKSGVDKEKPKSLSLLDVLNLEGGLDNNLEYVNDRDQIELSRSELNRKLKYCKNPMERRLIQRELSSLDFMCGRHRKGKRK